MSESYFESRKGVVEGTAEEVYNFVSDIRNFEQFIQKETVTNWHSEGESASFKIPMLGSVSFRITEKERYNKVSFAGDALKDNDFSLTLNITGNGMGKSEIMIFMHADLNPLLQTMAAKPIAQFLEKLVAGMEAFKGWKNIKT